MAEADAGPRDDPFIRRVDALGQIFVGNALGRQGRARAENDGVARH
jgi:hypothetical protein